VQEDLEAGQPALVSSELDSISVIL